MDIKEFCNLAIENGYGKNNGLCAGWDWMRDNLYLLDYIFDTPEYKACNRYKHKCMPVIIKGCDLTDSELDVLSTAWYLNNERQDKKERAELRQKMLNEGWLLLTSDIVRQAIRDSKRLMLKAISTSDWLSTGIEGVFRPYNDKGHLFLIAPKCKRKGFFLNSISNEGKDAFCKIV